LNLRRFFLIVASRVGESMRRLSILCRVLVTLAAGVAVAAHPLAPQVALAFDDDWDDDDDGDDWDDWDDEGEDEEYQPPVTSGGLYTKRTYPIAELERPLTLIGGMAEIRLGIDIDLSNEQAFENWRGVLEGRYGLLDHLELQFGADFKLVGEVPGRDAGITLGVENAIVYDLVNFRALVDMPLSPDFKFDLAFGFPFRYRYKDKVGIVALDKLMTIHTDGRKPDLTVGVGGIAQPVKEFAVIVRGEVIVSEFNFDESIAIPLTAAAQFSPANLFDIGLEFTFANVNLEGGRFASRFLLLYAQARF
jgi:hypothetical protein